MLRIKLIKSAFGNNPRNRATIEALGLRKIRQVVEHKDTPSIRGMIHHVKHVLLVEEVADPVEATSAAPKKSKAAKAEAPVLQEAVASKAAATAENGGAEAEPTPKPARKPRAKKEEGEAE